MKEKLTIFRRFAVVCALGLWLGGTTLYTGFVIPIAHRQVPASEFGLVTQEVTRVLNWIGVIAVAILLWDGWANRKVMGRFLHWGSSITYLLLIASLAVLWDIHGKLVFRVSRPMSRFPNANFEFWHDGYKLVTAIQWGAALLHLGLVIASWRRADSTIPDRKG